jgi:hypothetical protein
LIHEPRGISVSISVYMIAIDKKCMIASLSLRLRIMQVMCQPCDGLFPDHDGRARGTRTCHFNLTISQHNPRCSNTRSDGNGMMRKSVRLFIIRSILQGQQSQARASSMDFWRPICNGLEAVLETSPTQPSPLHHRHATPAARLSTAMSSTMSNPTARNLYSFW